MNYSLLVFSAVGFWDRVERDHRPGVPYHDFRVSKVSSFRRILGYVETSTPAPSDRVLL